MNAYLVAGVAAGGRVCKLVPDEELEERIVSQAGGCASWLAEATIDR